MNDKFTDLNHEKQIVQKIDNVAEQINANSQFAMELEKRLKDMHNPKTNWFTASFKQISPVLRWVALMILLGVVLSLSIETLIPAPQPAINDTPSVLISTPTPGVVTHETATPGTQNGGYDWHDAKLYLAAPLPESPAQANVYLLKTAQDATLEEALALAQQFGIEGESYPPNDNWSDTAAYMITDGAQRLYVRSKNQFWYFAHDLHPGTPDSADEEVQAVIDSFLKSRGFDFDYRIEHDETPGNYNILPLTPDGYGIHFDYDMPCCFKISLGDDGQVSSMESEQIEYEAVGTYEIRSVEEAFQQVLASADTVLNGVIETMRSSHGGGSRATGFYQLNLSGTPVPFPSPTAQPEGNPGYTYFVEAGDSLASIAIQFNVPIESLAQANQLSSPYSLSEGDTLIIPDLPPEAESGATEYIVQEGDTLAGISLKFGVGVVDLINVNNLPSNGLIFIGQPLIIPDARVKNSNLGRRVENQRGGLEVAIYQKSDGGQRTDYHFITSMDGENFEFHLTGKDFQELNRYQNLPIDITGTITEDSDGTLTFEVQEYSIPFPDLKFQILRGKEQLAEIEGQKSLLFITNEGTTYVQGNQFGEPLSDPSLFYQEGEPLAVEALVFPEKTFGGYPVIHTFSSAQDTGQSNDLTITANQIVVFDEELTSEEYVAPDATIEIVELVYYVNSPYYGINDPSYQPSPYLQPVWRFAGHYSDGSTFEILVQALKQEFLLPELAPYTPPG